MEWRLRSIWLSISLHLIKLTSIPYVDATVKFVSAPPKVLYVPVNGTAKFKWDYTVTDRINELKDQSPTWEHHLPNGSSIQLAYENTNNRSWRVSDSCPANLRGRINIESPATLVISQVTLADSGIYGCSLILSTGELIRNTSQLIVFDPPTFIDTPSDAIEILEGKDLEIKCSATGNPVPNVEWYGPKGSMDVISSGKGSASLKMRNIRRHSSGIYVCQANNRLPQPIFKKTSVIIYYRPTVNVAPSTLLNAPSWNNHIVILHCMATGNPLPVVSWKSPNGNAIQYGVSRTKNGSILTLTTKEEDDYGEYKCRATNSLGFDDLHFKVFKIGVPGPPMVREITSKLSSISIKWRRAPDDGGSPIIDYKVTINTNPVREVSLKDNFIVIGALEENTRYLVNISARNMVGHGNVTSIVGKTKKGSILSSDRSTVVALAVCLPIIFILVLIIILILIYLWWKRRKSKEDVNHHDYKVQDAETNATIKGERSEERQKNNGHARAETGHKSGSCFQPFIKRPRRRPGQPRPLPLHILEPIKEEISDESVLEQEDEGIIEEDETISEKERTCTPVKHEEITIESKTLDSKPEFDKVSIA